MEIELVVGTRRRYLEGCSGDLVKLLDDALLEDGLRDLGCYSWLWVDIDVVL